MCRLFAWISSFNVPVNLKKNFSKFSHILVIVLKIELDLINWKYLPVIKEGKKDLFYHVYWVSIIEKKY